MRDRANTSTSFLTVLGLAIVAALVAFASPALAAQTHPYTGTSFGPDGVGGTKSFERLQGIAVDPANGDTYVYDGGAGKVYKFNSSGAPVNFSATGTNAISGVGGGPGGAEYEIALAPAGSPGGTAGNIYVANNGQAIHVYSSAGTELGELDQGGETCGAATDPSGNLYAGVYGSTINKYTPSANPPSGPPTATGTVDQGICNVAADGLGNVYAANYNGNGLYKLEGIGDISPTKIDPGANTMAIAPGSNDLYADRGNEVFQYDSSSSPIGSFGNGELSESHGVAVNSGASKIYVGTPTKVKVFGPFTTVPDATTEAADAITKTTATLHGTVGAAGGPDATCVFQYVTENAFFEHGFEGASEKPCAPAGPFSGSGTTAVSATVTGLSTTTGYRFRLLATSSNGSNGGSAFGFSTPGAVNVQTDPATGVTASSATLHGTVNPEGTELEGCSFEYRHGFGTFDSVPCAESPATIGPGNSPVSVHADLTGLVEGTDYEFRLASKNEFGSSQASSETFKTFGPSVVGSPTASSLDTSAKFHGQVSPNGELTTYSFEYVTKAEFEDSGFANAVEVPVGGASAGSGSGEVEVEAEVSGLQPNSAYVVRLVANNPSGYATSPSVDFRTYSPAASGLPDGRAYEQVTPTTALEKNAGNAYNSIYNGSYASASGDAASYFSVTGAGNTPSSIVFPTYIAYRGSEAWTSKPSNPPASTGTGASYLGFTEDLSGSYVVASTPGVIGGLYLNEVATGELIPIATGLSQKEPANTYLVAESSGGNLVMIESPAKLTPEATAGNQNLYIWSKATGALRLVSIEPGGASFAGAFGGPWAYRNERPGTGGAAVEFYTQNALNDDGTKAFFTDKTNLQLYMRSDPADDAGTTTLISGSQKTNGPGGGEDPNGRQSAQYVEATPDGSYVFFMSKSALTNDANTGPSDEGEDLYRYDTATGKLLDLAPEPNGAGSEALGVVGVSNDGSYVYFVAKAALAPGAVAGERNIYLWHKGEGLQFVYTLTQFEPDEENYMNSKRFGGGLFGQKASRVTADGRTLMFMTHKSELPLNPGGYSEIYRWEAGGNVPVCVSCNPTGVAAHTYVKLQEGASAFGTPVFSRSIATRNMSANGKRVIFGTAEALVPNDTNGVEDVYEWEADGEGSCTGSRDNGGCIYLISTGTSSDASYLSDVSENGTDVFFFTSQRLVGVDKDELYDQYDARVGGGLASQNPVPVRPCEGEACLGVGTTASPAQPRGSSTFSGSGNEKPKHKKKKHKKKHKKKQQKNRRNSGGKR